MNHNYFVAIMAGGVGSRFWPASRKSTPKQFLDITGSGASLLQQTVSRLEGLVPLSNILIVSNIDYAGQILEQLPMLTKDQLLLEPTRNNTAPCVAYTALHLRALNPEAVFAVLPADHIIKKEKEFIKAMEVGLAKASLENAIVTLGIEPTRPDTGYGYIHHDGIVLEDGTTRVNSFKEKPDVQTAKKYLAQGDYVWNAGIFIWSCKTIIQAFDSLSPQITKILNEDISKYGTPEEQDYINKVYPLTECISVDYAILEKSTNVYTIPVDIGWSDLGTWNSLYAYMAKDADNNVVFADHTEFIDTSRSLIRLSDKEKLVVIKGLSDFIVIDEDDVLLICPREDEQEIKEIRSSLKDKQFE